MNSHQGLCCSMRSAVRSGTHLDGKHVLFGQVTEGLAKSLVALLRGLSYTMLVTQWLRILSTRWAPQAAAAEHAYKMPLNAMEGIRVHWPKTRAEGSSNGTPKNKAATVRNSEAIESLKVLSAQDSKLLSVICKRKLCRLPLWIVGR